MRVSLSNYQFPSHTETPEQRAAIIAGLKRTDWTQAQRTVLTGFAIRANDPVFVHTLVSAGADPLDDRGAAFNSLIQATAHGMLTLDGARQMSDILMNSPAMKDAGRTQILSAMKEVAGNAQTQIYGKGKFEDGPGTDNAHSLQSRIVAELGQHAQDAAPAPARDRQPILASPTASGP